MARMTVALLLLLGLILPSACGTGKEGQRIVMTFPLDDLQNVVQREDEEFSIDEQETYDGNGALYVRAAEKRVCRLFEVLDPDVENGLLTWKAQVRCASVYGNVFLEMWCRLPGEGEFFSRGLETAIQRSTDWTELQTSFRLEKGQKPDRVRLNLIIESAGHVWIDAAKLELSPLPR